MKSTRIRILTIGAAVLLAAAAAIAQGRHGFGGPGGDFRHGQSVKERKAGRARLHD